MLKYLYKQTTQQGIRLNEIQSSAVVAKGIPNKLDAYSNLYILGKKIIIKRCVRYGTFKTSASRKISVQYSKTYDKLRMRGVAGGGDCTEFSTIQSDANTGAEWLVCNGYNKLALRRVAL